VMTRGLVGVLLGGQGAALRASQASTWTSASGCGVDVSSAARPRSLRTTTARPRTRTAAPTQRPTMSGVEPCLAELPLPSVPESSVFPSGREKVSSPQAPPYEEHVGNAAMVFGLDAGDADVEPVVGALDDGELVVALASLRARKASTQASGRARGRGDDEWGSRMDAGNADVEEVVVAGLDGERVVFPASLRVREASTRASGRARGRGEDGLGFRVDAGDADLEGVAVALDDGELVVASISVFEISLRAREASTRASGRARADEATADGYPGWTRETLTER